MNWTFNITLDINKIKFIIVSFLIVLSNACLAVSIDKGHDLEQLRGAMVGQIITKKDIYNFAQNWNANHIRWALYWDGSSYWDKNNAWDDFSKVTDLLVYRKWLNYELDNLDSVLGYFEQLGIKVLIDLHTPPGGRAEDEVNRVFREQKYLDEFYKLWKDIAVRYKGREVIWGYELLNEPVQGRSSKVKTALWHKIATQAATLIRAVDSEHIIVFEPSPWAKPSAFKHLKPLDVAGIVYSFHLYEPHPFSHQGVEDHGPIGLTYPGQIDGELWNKNRLKEEVQAVVDFQNKYKLAIYIGEFSSVRWTPDDSAYRYMKDSIEIFEENNWDWAYHAYRDDDDNRSWSVEHDNKRSNLIKTTKPTTRQKLLQSWFKHNKKAHYDLSD
ncbi:MAG: cellulase family glycosylhydrolase [Pseudomonadota bacterium]